MDQELKSKLSEEPPSGALKHRDQAGKTLTYVEGHYIIETMNNVFGPENWSREFCGGGLRVMSKHEDIPPGKKNVRYDVTMLCEYRIRVNGQVIEDVGYGSGMSYVDWGASIESAAKEAVTDALKRCCRSLGNALGNCLYNKAWLDANANGGERVPYPSGDPPPARTQTHISEELGI